MAVLFVRPAYPEGYRERRLLATILRRAAWDIALYKGSTKLLERRCWKDAHDWMMSDLESHFTSFVSICNILDQDPGTIRRKTMLLRREDVRKFDWVE